MDKERKSVWTPEVTAEAKRLISEGKSAGQVAITIGSGLTRSSVVSKAKRMKWALRPPRRAEPKPVAQHGGKRKIIVANGHVMDAGPRVYLMPEIVWPEAPNEHSCTIWGLTQQTCRWPLWDVFGAPENNLFCGESKEAGSAYCTRHRAIYTRSY